jgi:hypothetical protein
MVHCMHTITEFFISTWLWHFTCGWMQVALNALLLWFLLYWIAHISLIRAFLLTVMAHVIVSLIFSACIFMLVHICEPDSAQMEQYTVIYTHPHYVTLSFGLLYSTLLILFFGTFHYAYNLPITHVYIATLLAALISSLITPLIICV